MQWLRMIGRHLVTGKSIAAPANHLGTPSKPLVNPPVNPQRTELPVCWYGRNQPGSDGCRSVYCAGFSQSGINQILRWYACMWPAHDRYMYYDSAGSHLRVHHYGDVLIALYFQLAVWR